MLGVLVFRVELREGEEPRATNLRGIVWPEICYSIRRNQTKTMTCRYAHKRVALLFTLVQATPAVRVIDWPQKPATTQDFRVRGVTNNGKSQRETNPCK